MSSSSGADSGGGGGDAAARVTIICSICMDTLMEEGSVQVATPCGHVFHKHCLMNWYTSSNKKNEERKRSQRKYCCPDCGKTTKSDSNCRFRLFLKTEEDSDYQAMFQTVSQLRREKDEIIERMKQEKAKALERLSQEQMETVDRLRLEHSEKVERLQQEHDEILRQENDKTKTLERNIQQLRQENAQSLEQLRQEQLEAMDHLRLEHSEKVERLQKEHSKQINRYRYAQIATVSRLRLNHANEKGQIHQLIQFQKNEIQLLKDDIQWQEEEIQNLKKPIDLERVKTLAPEKLQREEDELMEKCKRLDKTGGSGGSECHGTEATGFGRGGGARVLSPGHHQRPRQTARKSTGMYSGWQPVQGTSVTTSSVKTTPPQHRFPSKRAVNAARGYGIASKKQKIDDNTKNCTSIKITVQHDMMGQTKVVVRRILMKVGQKYVTVKEMFECSKCPGNLFNSKEDVLEHLNWHNDFCRILKQ